MYSFISVENMVKCHIKVPSCYNNNKKDEIGTIVLKCLLNGTFY